MALDLSITFGKGGSIPGHQCFPHARILLPIPEAEVVVENILTTTWPLGFGGFSQPIMSSPDALWRLHIRLSNTRDEVEGELLVFFAAVHGLMQLRDCRYELYGIRNLEVGGPVGIHSAKEVHEPLAGDVVADEDEGEGAEVLDVYVDDEGEYTVHVAVSAQGISSRCHTSSHKNTPFAFLQVSNA